MRLLVDNLATDAATTLSASSANTNFPASNLQNPLRSKRWRSNSYGTFVIDSTNNKINFKESGGGSQLTATVASATYTASTLATAIVTALEAAGANEYTAEYSTATGKWTIATSDGIYLSLLNNTGTNQATSCLKLACGFSNTDRTGALTYTGANIAIHTQESIVFDLATIEDVNSVVLLWPKETGIILSDTAVLKIQANATNSWGSPSVNQTITINEDYTVVSHFFSTTQSYRYWRVVVQDPTNSNLYVELGAVWIGINVDFDEPQNGFTFRVEDQSHIVSTEYGHEYVDEYPLKTQLDFSYSYLIYETAQALENAFRTNGTRKPVIVCFDESESVFDKDHFLIYGKMQKAYEQQHVSYNLFNGKLSITELG